MGDSNYWKRPLKLHELLEEIENIDDDDSDKMLPLDIVIFPPENANDYVTDEDSGDEELVTLNNLPGGQLRSTVEILNRSPNSEDVQKTTNEEYESEDDLPLATFTNTENEISGPSTSGTNFKNIRSFSWVDSASQHQTFQEWNAKHDVKNENTPLELFEFFFDQQITEMIQQYTNLYATQKNNVGDITVEEIKCFTGVLLLSGYVCLPRRYMYWEMADDSNNKLVQAAISRDRFTYIMKHLHCCDNGNLGENDKYAKIRLLFDGLNHRFLEFSPEEEYHSVDEAMVPYYGRHSCKQFIRNKPIRWGYKFWTGTTRSGYVTWFEPYQGAAVAFADAKTIGLGSSIIMRYANVLQSFRKNASFHLFFDNYFTSLPLLDALASKGIKATGTVRENRLGSCPLAKSALLKKESRGVYKHIIGESESNAILVCKWNDNSVVTIASNALSVEPICQVKRYSQKEKKTIFIDQPALIRYYNKNMGGVDRCDQNISLYRTSIRGKKWYFPLITQCIDMAEQNAWQLHRYQGGKMDHLCFRRAIATNLLETYKRQPKRGRPRQSVTAHAFSRYDRLDHLIIYQEQQTRCGVCHKKVQFRCEKCDIGLHPKECFKQYHHV